MIDLTTSADFFRRSSLGAIAGIIGFVIILVLYMNWGSVSKALFPPAPAPATVAFGKVPKLDLTIGYEPPSGAKYTLQTVSGDLPTLPTKAKVFAISGYSPSFSDADVLRRKIQGLGFEAKADSINGNMYTFRDLNNSERVVVANSLTGNLTFETNYLTNPATLSSKPRSTEEVKALAKGFFNSAGLKMSNYPESKIETINLRIDGGNLIPANSISSANVIEVIYNFMDLDKLQVLSARADDPRVFAIVDDRAVVEAKIVNLPIQKNNFSTYPLKGVAKAFEELQSGNSAFNNVVGNQDLTVTSVKLGYVVGESDPEFLTPVYLFNLANDVTAYVDAIDGSWVR